MGRKPEGYVVPYDDRKITFEDRKILFRNFSGEEGKFNAKGRRNFCIVALA